MTFWKAPKSFTIADRLPSWMYRTNSDVYHYSIFTSVWPEKIRFNGGAMSSNSTQLTGNSASSSTDIFLGHYPIIARTKWDCCMVQCIATQLCSERDSWLMPTCNWQWFLELATRSWQCCTGKWRWLCCWPLKHHSLLVSRQTNGESRLRHFILFKQKAKRKSDDEHQFAKDFKKWFGSCPCLQFALLDNMNVNLLQRCLLTHFDLICNSWRLETVHLIVSDVCFDSQAFNAGEIWCKMVSQDHLFVAVRSSLSWCPSLWQLIRISGNGTALASMFVWCTFLLVVFECPCFALSFDVSSVSLIFDLWLGSLRCLGTHSWAREHLPIQLKRSDLAAGLNKSVLFEGTVARFF